MNALRKTHDALTVEGLLLDIHPVRPAARVEASGAVLGRLRERAFFDTVAATERELAKVVRARMFAYVGRTERDVADRFDSGQELLETVDEWEGSEVPRAVRRRVERADGPVVLVNRVTFRLLRAVPDAVTTR